MKIVSLKVLITAFALIVGSVGLASAGSADDSSRAGDKTKVRSKAKATAKAAPPDCNTGWTRPTGGRPKTFAWQQTSSWVLVHDGLWVRFRSLGGNYYERLNRNCKTVRGWRAGATLYQTKAHVPNVAIPRISNWSSDWGGQNTCGGGNPKAHMNKIVACYRQKLYDWTPSRSPI
jgi:hypothetical protein